MFIDTHCHLTEDYPDGIDGVIERASSNNVGIMVAATAEPNDIPVTLDIAHKHKNIFCTIGFHPDCAGTVNSTKYLTSEILQDDSVVGIGEIGLDYHDSDFNRDAQIKLFSEQLEIAQQYNLPVVIHTRQAEQDTQNILTNKNRGVLHCYTAGWDLAKKILDYDFYFSASGILTFKSADDVRDVFAKLPLNRIVVETDSPFCAPVPFRGKQCESYMVRQTAQVLADIKQLQISDLETILLENTLNLFPKINMYKDKK